MSAGESFSRSEYIKTLKGLECFISGLKNGIFTKNVTFFSYFRKFADTIQAK